MSDDIFFFRFVSTQCGSDSSLYRIKTPNKMIMAVCHTIQTAGRLRWTLVFFWRSHSCLKLCTLPILSASLLFFLLIQRSSENASSRRKKKHFWEVTISSRADDDYRTLPHVTPTFFHLQQSGVPLTIAAWLWVIFFKDVSWFRLSFLSTSKIIIIIIIRLGSDRRQRLSKHSSYIHILLNLQATVLLTCCQW